MRYFICLAMAAAAFGQTNPLAADAKRLYLLTVTNISKSAEKVPEENYSFKPTPEVRSFGQLIGHVADAQYLFCSAVKGDKPAPLGIEKSKTSKADLIAALKEAVAYCTAVYDGMTDQAAPETVKFFGRDQTKLGVLSFNSIHNYEHYGNLVTYMRLKGIVPPSSEGR